MNIYKVIDNKGMKRSIKATYLKSAGDEVIFYRAVSGEYDEFVASFRHPVSVILEVE